MRITTIALLIASLGCASPSHPGDPGSVNQGILVQPGREFDIGAGQEVSVAGTGITVRFNGVTDDSRCAIDVQCVWAGNAVVRVTLGAPGAASIDAALNTTLDPKSATFAGHTVRLTALKPQPRSGTAIAASSYVATLEVRPISG